MAALSANALSFAVKTSRLIRAVRAPLARRPSFFSSVETCSAPFRSLSLARSGCRESSPEGNAWKARWQPCHTRELSPPPVSRRPGSLTGRCWPLARGAEPLSGVEPARPLYRRGLRPSDNGVSGPPGNRTLISGLQDRGTPIVLAAHSRVRGESNSLPEIWSFRCALRSDPWRHRSDSNRPHSGDNRAATPSHPRAFRLLAASRTRTARLGNERLESARTRRWGDVRVMLPPETRSQRAGFTCSLTSQSAWAESNCLPSGPNGVRDHYATRWCRDSESNRVVRCFKPAQPPGLLSRRTLHGDRTRPAGLKDRPPPPGESSAWRPAGESNPPCLD